jgi:hypothetical protein
MKKIELSVEFVFGVKEPFIRYEWFGLKNQTKRIKRFVDLDEN